MNNIAIEITTLVQVCIPLAGIIGVGYWVVQTVKNLQFALFGIDGTGGVMGHVNVLDSRISTVERLCEERHSREAV